MVLIRMSCRVDGRILAWAPRSLRPTGAAAPAPGGGDGARIVGVKRIVRLLLLCILALALPMGAYAGAGMGVVVPGATGHAGHAGQAGHAPCHDASPQADADVSDVHDMQAKHGAKAGSCAACCIGAALAPTLPFPPPLAHADSLPIPFHAGYLPSVDPVLPERPPQHSLA
jgi:hypothetical protein